MLCLRCGHCCINYAVVLPDGTFYAGDGIGCKNLRWEAGDGDRLNKAVCAVYGQDAVFHQLTESCRGYGEVERLRCTWEETPCGRHGQIECSKDTPCRMGEFVLKKAVYGHLRGSCIFFTGLSGAGKTTLAGLLRDALTTEDRYITLADGDAVRALSDVKLTFSKEHRDLNVRRVGFLAKEIVLHGGTVICALIAPYEETRHEIEASISAVGNFFLIYVATSIEECEHRDVKGLYARARRGEIQHFTGIDDPYEVPGNAHLTIDTTDRTPGDCLQQILTFLQDRHQKDLS